MVRPFFFSFFLRERESLKVRPNGCELWNRGRLLNKTSIGRELKQLLVGNYTIVGSCCGLFISMAH